MTQQEAALVVKMLRAAYPKFYQSLSSDEALQLVNVWATVAGDYPAEAIRAGLVAFIASDTKGFPPTAGQVIERLVNLKDDELNPSEAWGMVRKAIQKGIYYSAEEYEKLPRLVQKAVGSPKNIEQWAQMDSGTIDSVIYSQFVSVYKTVVNRAKEDMKIPHNVRALIGKTVERIGELQ